MAILIIKSPSYVEGQSFKILKSPNWVEGQGMKAVQTGPVVIANPPGAPTNLRMTGDPDYNVWTLEWDFPIDNGGSEITGYTLYLDGNLWMSMGAGTSYIIGGLSFGPSSVFSVTVSNAAGEGPQSDPFVFTYDASMVNTVVPAGQFTHNGTTVSWPSFDVLDLSPGDLSGWTVDDSTFPGQRGLVYSTRLTGSQDGLGAREFGFDVTPGVSGTYIYVSTLGGKADGGGPLVLTAPPGQLSNVVDTVSPTFNRPIYRGDGLLFSVYNAWDKPGNEGKEGFYALAMFTAYIDAVNSTYTVVPSGSMTHNGVVMSWPTFDASSPPATLEGGWTLQPPEGGKSTAVTYLFDTPITGSMTTVSNQLAPCLLIDFDVETGLSGTDVIKDGKGSYGRATREESLNVTGSYNYGIEGTYNGGLGGGLGGGFEGGGEFTPNSPQYPATAIATWDGSTSGWDNNSNPLAVFKCQVDAFEYGLSAPVNLSPATGGDGEVVLTWSAPAHDGGSAVTGYSIFVDDVEIDTVDSTTFTYAVTGLTNGTQYKFGVRASNATTVGPIAEQNATPSAGVILLPMGSVTASIGGETLTLSWPHVFQGPLGGMPNIGGTLGDFVRVATEGSESYRFEYSQGAYLPDGRGIITYDVDVAEATSAGWQYGAIGGTGNSLITVSSPENSNWSPGNPGYLSGTFEFEGGGAFIIAWPIPYAYFVIPFFFDSVGGTVPDAPINLAATPGDSQVYLEWDPPTNDGGWPITIYKVYKVDPGGDILIGGNSVATNYTVGSKTVSNGTEYTFYVTAVNRIGESVGSSTITATPSA